MQTDCFHLFVYGTLRDGHVNHKAHFLQAHAECVGKGHIRARLYKVTWYPAVVLDPQGDDRVYGEVYALPVAAVEMILHELDGYEGIYTTNEASDEYERVTTTAWLEDGSALVCWVYNYKKPADGLVPIASGDYLLYLKTGD